LHIYELIHILANINLKYYLMANVVRTTINFWREEQNHTKTLISGQSKLYSNLLKAYNAVSLQLELSDLELPSYSAVQKGMSADVQIWAKQFLTNGGLIYVSFEREVVI
jgi:dimeric dUTPase (all-alpha-NTP-PPase superfamily)